MLKFQILDADYTYDVEGRPVVRLYGRDVEGASVCCFVPGFKPYFYLRASGVDLTRLKAEFPQIQQVEEVECYPPVGYYRKPVSMYRIVVLDPKDVPDIRGKLSEFGEVFETDILFRNRFLIDSGLGGMQWACVEVEGDVGGIDVEGVDCDRRVVGVPVPVEEVHNAPLRYLAFDIECLTTGGMPDVKTSPIVLISLYFSPAYRGQESLVLSAREVLGGSGVVDCGDEVSMLNRFFEVIRDFDPDVIFGYNSSGFDFPYIVDRVKHLDAGIKTNIGRDGRPIYYRRIGTTTHVSVTGRIIADVLPIIRREFSLKQYTLKNAARELLGLEKHDVRVEDMQRYWEDDELLSTFIEYCRNDSYLAMEMMMRYRLLDKYIALARVSGSLLQDILDSGQTSMVENLLLKEYRVHRRVMPPKPDDKTSSQRQRMGEELKGGEVLEPKQGLLENIVILDYRSLYPSIMMAHNLCYTTEIVGDEPEHREDIITTPSGGRFVSRRVQRGVLPMVLERLFNQRVEIKNQMRRARGDEVHVLDATQLALKILLNSFYGYSGYARARLYSLTLANSVTSYGRETILNTKKLIEEELQSVVLIDSPREVLTLGEARDRRVSGREVRLEVVYGDTDSVFVRLDTQGGLGVDDAALVGEKIAEVVTSSLERPMELVFEAFARRAIFLAKKRYAIWVFERSGDGCKDAIRIKGMETVRRDWCELASNTLNEVLELVLRKGSVEEATRYVRGVINGIRTLDISENPDALNALILTRRYTKKSESYHSRQPHITVVEKLRRRGGVVPNIGDRVPFVITAGNGLLVERAEDPEYAVEHRMPIDTDYYINKQILPPIERIFKSLGISTKQLSNRSTATVRSESKGSQKSLFEF